MVDAQMCVEAKTINNWLLFRKTDTGQGSYAVSMCQYGSVDCYQPAALYVLLVASMVAQIGKESACNAGEPGSIPG